MFHASREFLRTRIERELSIPSFCPANHELIAIPIATQLYHTVHVATSLLQDAQRQQRGNEMKKRVREAAREERVRMRVKRETVDVIKQEESVAMDAAMTDVSSEVPLAKRSRCCEPVTSFPLVGILVSESADPSTRSSSPSASLLSPSTALSTAGLVEHALTFRCRLELYRPTEERHMLLKHVQQLLHR